MSLTVLSLAKSFVMERLSADQFSDAYMEIWKFERDSNLFQKDEAKLNGCLSSIFCLADLYNPESDSEEYELDEKPLRNKISELISDLE